MPLEEALGGKAKRGAMFDGKEFRSLIADIEERGFIYMAGAFMTVLELCQTRNGSITT